MPNERFINGIMLFAPGTFGFYFHRLISLLMLSKEKKVVETNGGKNPVSTGNLHHTSTKVKLKTNDVQLFFRISLSDDIISFLSLTNIKKRKHVLFFF